MTPSLLHANTVGVKICGLSDEECVDVAIGSGADAIGFVFVSDSPRCIQRHDANQLCLQLPEDVLAVAVLQDHPCLSDFEDWNGWLQLCGDENESTIAYAPRPVIRAFQWSRESVERWDGCENVRALLVDGSSGGLGQTFDIAELADMIPTLATPVIVAGGLTDENVGEVVQLASPAAVDVSSGVESSAGVKDPQKICAFINRVKGGG